MSDRELLLERLERLAIVLDELMPQCAELVRDALAMLKERETENIYKCPNCGTWVFAENVVRCKDCIYGEHEKNESTGTGWIYCAHHRENRPNEWFCASGSPTIKQKGRKME